MKGSIMLPTVHHIKIDKADNVATALADLPAGTTLTLADDPDRPELVLVDAIAFGHKFAVQDILAAAEVIKYGATIGRASRAIRTGEHVHVHNTESNRGRGDLPVAPTPVVKSGGRS
jgi:altronate dehydratase small subunit